MASKQISAGLLGRSVQFILRREALCLYRQFLRVRRDVGGEREREEMRRWVRGEFDKWRHTTDEVRGGESKGLPQRLVQVLSCIQISM